MIRMLTILTAALTAVMLTLTPPASAQSWTTPALGSDLRTDLLSAIRPHIEWALGAPIEFVVWEMRVKDDLAFASLWAQRPGGGEIDLHDTPAARYEMLDPTVGDGPTIQVLYRKSGRVWVAVHHAISATDVWYAWEPMCAIWQPVIPDTCAF